LGAILDYSSVLAVLIGWIRRAGIFQANAAGQA
jgi:hypothetical protein